MLYVCLPIHNEAVTAGVLLWRLRTILREQAGGRDYEVVVYDDASTDATADVLAPYARVLPLTLLRGERRVGQAGAVDALVRHVVARARAPEADAVVLMQADYTDAPELLPALLAGFDAGADLVLTRRPLADDQPPAERRLRRAVPVVLPPFIRPALRDAAARDPAALVSFLRLFRASVLRDALRAAGGAPLVTRPGWAGTAELLVRTAPFAPRIERVDAPARYDVRTRPSRIDWLPELRALAAVLWQHRGGGAVRRPGPDATGSAGGGVSGRMDRPMDRSPGGTTPAPHTSPNHPPTAPPPNAPPPAGLDAVEAADTTDEPAVAKRPPRRRRRGRGRTSATGPTPAESTEPEGSHAGGADNTTYDEPSTEVGAPADAGGPPSGTADAPRKRRRRRGGARRGARGTAEEDVGVRPADADVDPATWQGTPSQRATSDHPPS